MTTPDDLPPRPPEYTPEEWAEYHRDPCGWCVKELRNPDPHVRCNAADILRGLAWDAADAIPALTTGCRDPDDQVRAYCTHALIDIAHAVHHRVPSALPLLTAAVPTLTAALDDAFWEVRALAADALAEIGHPAVTPAIPHLHSHLADPNPHVRDATAKALQRLTS